MTLIVLLLTAFSQATTNSTVCSEADPDFAYIDFRIPHDHCLTISGGFAHVPGSFARISYSMPDVPGLRARLSLSAEAGVRERRAALSVSKPLRLIEIPVETGFQIYAQRFHYDQARESSIFAFDRNIASFDSFQPDDLANYVHYSYGIAGFTRFIVGKSRAAVDYRYDIANVRTLTSSTQDYFGYVNFQDALYENLLRGIRDSAITLSYQYDSVNGRTTPRGIFVSALTTISGLGGNVHRVEPAIEAKYFRAGFARNHTIAARLKGRLLSGYGDQSAPPFDRYFLGGEDEMRGFDSWSGSPMAYVASSTTIPALNNDGTPRMQRVIVNGQPTFVLATTNLPIDRLVTLGGDTKIVGNFEYRIPLGGPFTVAMFADAGLNRVTFRDQVQLNPGRIEELNFQYPEAARSGRVTVQPGTQDIRMSTGLELQYFVKKIAAPIRFYWAQNVLTNRAVLTPPFSADRSYYPNAATFLEGQALFRAPTIFADRRFMFRFAIGRMF